MRPSENAILAALSAAAIAGGLVIAALSWPAHTASSTGAVNRNGALYPPPARVAGQPPEGGCDAVSFGHDAGAKAAPGSRVTLTASARGCSDPLYRFWIMEPGSRWSMVQDYSTTKTYAWTPPAKLGAYTFEVDVRDVSQSTQYDATAKAVFTVAGCTAAQMSANKPAPQAHGTTVMLKASASCPAKATYRFWVRGPGDRWRVVRQYSSQSTFAWAAEAAGTYELEVDVRGDGSGVDHETVANLTYRVT